MAKPRAHLSTNFALHISARNLSVSESVAGKSGGGNVESQSFHWPLSPPPMIKFAPRA